MQIIEVETAGLRVAALEGRLDTGAAPEVEERLLGLLDEAGVLVDLAEVRFVSSAGLRILLRAAKTAKAAGRAFALCALRPAVVEVFEISGFDRVLRTFATRDDALAALA